MDGTLLDLNFDNHFWLEFVPQRYAQKNQLSLAAAKQFLQPLFKSMEGRLEWYCLDYWSQQLNLDIANLKAEISGLIDVLPHVTEFLTTLQQTDKTVLLVTNAHPDSLSLKMEKTCLQPFFEQIICSHDFGFAKEHQPFWEAFQAQQGFTKQATLMVDDSLSVLRAAQSFGIAHLININKPDSQKAAKFINEFPAITDFREIMPPNVT
ncbi:FIG001957: putative hydrolase [methanotrophic endosymbiont of Bathymodiolus puteoserpentis (Logatchev)]|nr:FIG001957: putative hydrolase [methanotrophic endosymbiont of Bathymodiolus puteoserpentis (Logatchev)]